MTYLEALNLLPLDYKDLAIQRAKEKPLRDINGIIDDIPTVMYKNNIACGLSRSFDWSLTEEGDDFWRNLFNQINTTNYNDNPRSS